MNPAANQKEQSAKSGSKMPAQPLVGKKYMPSLGDSLSEREMGVLQDLDPDKLSDMAEVLYAFNNYKVGPMPGFYVAFELTPGKEWCVGQLCADRAKPIKLFDDKIYKKAETAQRAAEKMRQKDLAELSK